MQNSYSYSHGVWCPSLHLVTKCRHLCKLQRSLSNLYWIHIPRILWLIINRKEYCLCQIYHLPSHHELVVQDCGQFHEPEQDESMVLNKHIHFLSSQLSCDTAIPVLTVSTTTQECGQAWLQMQCSSAAWTRGWWGRRHLSRSMVWTSFLTSPHLT